MGLGRRLLYGTSYGNSAMTWGALTTSNNITHTANTDSFQVSQAGTYAISCYAFINAINTGGVFQMIGRYSTNGTTWSNVLVSHGSSSYMVNTTMFLQGIATTAANSYFSITTYNTTSGNVTLNSTTPFSYFHMYRIG